METNSPHEKAKHMEMAEFLRDLNEKTLGAYQLRPAYLNEHRGIEQTVLAGGYGYRQILELIQNGADAILEAYEGGQKEQGKIEVLLKDSNLYVANTGASVSMEGVDALLTSHNSSKRGNQIGRFGLGFKSLLRLGGTIDLFSATWGGIRFNPKRCQAEIRYQFDFAEPPMLRLAWSFEPQEMFSDANISGFSSWAETVVRVGIDDPMMIPPLKAEIIEFPAEFLLFNPIAISLSLDIGEEKAKIVSVEGENQTRKLVVGATSSEWRLFQIEVNVTDGEAKADATHIHARETVPLSWAVPIVGRREEAGRFWAFFPTKTPTYISGILNAPWKLNSDRQALISGAWNDMLMRKAAKLVTDSIMSLSDPEDPGKHLDYFPRRPDAGDIAIPLLEEIWNRLEDNEVIPDSNGALRKAAELTCHPTDQEVLLKAWMELADEDTRGEYVHPTCLTRDRRARLAALSDRISKKETQNGPCCRRRDWHEWIIMVASREPEAVKSVLKLASQLRQSCIAEVWDQVRPKLRIIPDNNGNLFVPGEVMIGPSGDLPPGVNSISIALLDDPEMLEILTVTMKVAELEDKVWVDRLKEALKKAGPWGRKDNEWKAFWSLLLNSPKELALDFARKNSAKIKVADANNNWVSPRSVLLPGRLVPAGDPNNLQVLVDQQIHGGSDYLSAAGVTDLPEGQINYNGDWGGADNCVDKLQSWLMDARSSYKRTHINGARPEYLFAFRLELPNGWYFLDLLKGLPAVQVTLNCLGAIDAEGFNDRVHFGHCTQFHYPAIEVHHPLLSWVLSHGKFQIGNNLVDLSAVVKESGTGWFSNVTELERFEAAFSKLRRCLDPDKVGLEEQQEFWHAVIPNCITLGNQKEPWVASVLNGAAAAGIFPCIFDGPLGEVPLSEVFVTTSRELADRVRSNDRIIFVINSTAVELWVSEGAQLLSGELRPHWEEASPGVALTAAFPEIQDALSEEIAQNGVAVRVLGLAMEFHGASQAVPCLLNENTLYFDGDIMDQMSLTERYAILLNELGNGGALCCTVDEALGKMINTQVDDRRSRVASGDTLESKLLLAVGSKAIPLRAALGELGEQPFMQTCELEDLARIVLRHLGPAALGTLSKTLEAEGLAPPARWGTEQAREFVRQIGFPEEFGESRTSKRGPEEWSQGPFPLPPLHDFQVEVRDGIKAMIESQKSARRAVISLPTGGGKTRVTVESAVEFTLKPESSRRGVLWIAQTDELCEQAVQAFRQVWPNRGAERTGLRIFRLWGGNPTPAIPEEGEPFVIVASIQTMDARGGLHGEEWATRFGMLVIDECHHSITPSYTRLLKGLGFDARAADEGSNPELIILGLSATPFRMNDEESKRLAARFAKRWFPYDQESLHRRLLEQGVLCKVSAEELRSGTGLNGSEEQELDRLYTPGDYDGIEFERLLERINQRLGDHEERNVLLVERIRTSSERSILFFANSVSHSYEIAARLNLAGIPAAAVSGETPRSARRYFLDQFQRGELRVLCNHSVLTTGFDAPKTDMLLIARQVFSPVRYMQMVGRGLRGVKNGGTEQCRIVTVLDNLGRFEDRHPYHYCRHNFEDFREVG